MRVAGEADVAVLVVGEHQEQSAEANNRAFLGLPGAQEGLVRAVRGAGKPVIVVLMGGRPLAISSFADSVPAIMHAW